MKLLFRKKFILQFLTQYEEQNAPLDLFLKRCFRNYKQIGSKDRKEIANTIYSIIRMKERIDYFCATPITWEKRFDTFHSSVFTTTPFEMEDHIQVSFPKFLFNKFKSAFGLEKTIKICHTLNESAPTTLRVNPLKSNRDDLIHSLSKYCELEVCESSQYGIRLKTKINLIGLDEYKKGFFEIQDEASQLVSFLVQAKPQDKVLDYCAGSGGKTLAFAPFMKNHGVIYLHDIRKNALIQAKNRLKRSGIQNIQFCFHPSQLTALKNSMDWILLDVPCSGTGTLRRNPDMKWKYSEAMIERLAQDQRKIFKQSFPLLKPKGKIIYATCSILPDENENQVKYFKNTFHLTEINSFKSLPEKGKMDGFFACVLQKL